MLACEKTSCPSITDIEQIHSLNFVNHTKAISKWGDEEINLGSFNNR
jgi:hypothetical protein